MIDLAFHALAEPRRREILRVLGERRARGRRDRGPVRRDAAGDQPAPRRSCARPGLVDERRDGTRRRYRVRTRGPGAGACWLDGFWRDRLDALKAAAEAEAGGDGPCLTQDGGAGGDGSSSARCWIAAPPRARVGVLDGSRAARPVDGHGRARWTCGRAATCGSSTANGAVMLGHGPRGRGAVDGSCSAGAGRTRPRSSGRARAGWRSLWPRSPDGTRVRVRHLGLPAGRGRGTRRGLGLLPGPARRARPPDAPPAWAAAAVAEHEPLADQARRLERRRPAHPRARPAPRRAPDALLRVVAERHPDDRTASGASSGHLEPVEERAEVVARRSRRPCAAPRGSVGAPRAASSAAARERRRVHRSGAERRAVDRRATRPGQRRLAQPDVVRLQEPERVAGIAAASASRTRHAGSRSTSHRSRSSASPAIAAASGAASANRGRGLRQVEARRAAARCATSARLPRRPAARAAPRRAASASRASTSRHRWTASRGGTGGGSDSTMGSSVRAGTFASLPPMEPAVARLRVPRADPSSGGPHP